MEFGPVLHPPRQKHGQAKTGTADQPNNAPIRFIAPGGEWNFSVRSAIWTIEAQGHTAGSAPSSSREIEQTLEFLNGQTLVRVEWTDQKTLLATFAQGGRIEAANNPSLEPDTLMWWLLQVDGLEIAMNALGLIDYETP